MPVKEAVDFLCSMYLDFAIPAFRLTHSGVKPETQIHTHMCYSEFTDIIPAIDDKVDFGDKIGMAQTIRDEIKTRSKDKKIFQDTILSENSNTIWIMWGGNE